VVLELKVALVALVVLVRQRTLMPSAAEAEGL
jgi:hypothetical protein